MTLQTTKPTETPISAGESDLLNANTVMAEVVNDLVDYGLISRKDADEYLDNHVVVTGSARTGWKRVMDRRPDIADREGAQYFIVCVPNYPTK